MYRILRSDGGSSLPPLKKAPMHIALALLLLAGVLLIERPVTGTV